LVVPVAVEVAELFVVVEFAVVVTAAVVMFEIPPEYERAATAPNAPTAATLAMVVPIVR
jgi:ABC-type sulfate transport system permease component